MYEIKNHDMLRTARLDAPVLCAELQDRIFGGGGESIEIIEYFACRLSQ